jgi:glycine cleavage system aminomethyltransferase T
MSLDFLSLSPDGPPPRSPLAEATAAGARSEGRDGWDVVTSYGDPEAEARACRESVGWADQSHLAKAEVSGDCAWLESLGSGRAAAHGEGWLGWISPGRGLLVGEAGTPPGGRLLDLTGGLAAIAITGPAARETIARFCALDTRPAALSEMGFRPGSLARTPGFLLREGGDRFLLLFGAAYGRYLWEVVSDAGERLGGRPVGVDVGRGAAVAKEVSVSA